MPHTIRLARWGLYLAWLLAATLALMMTVTPGLALLGLAPESISFTAAKITGLPWTLPLFLLRLDSVTTLAVIMVAHLLNIALGLMLVRAAE